jgi:hypothetical protein
MVVSGEQIVVSGEWLVVYFKLGRPDFSPAF